MEQTFTIIKPGILQRRLVGNIISTFEAKGFRIIAMKMIKISNTVAEKHYGEHKGKDFYMPLIKYMTSEPVIIMVLERENAIESLRKITGSTNPDKAEAGTIRGKYGVSTRKNIIHASDSIESAVKEIELFFKPEELHIYNDNLGEWF
ncbi:MAG: nucleoside-diphosphate kinase [Spirochaetes bacterium]|nr:MAG: nucleoside-diphosphate kinase [Spirochaetota bacterium]